MEYLRKGLKRKGGICSEWFPLSEKYLEGIGGRMWDNHSGEMFGKKTSSQRGQGGVHQMQRRVWITC